MPKGVSLDKFGDDYSFRLRKNLPKEANWEEIIILENGLAVGIANDGKTLIPYGCPKCVGKELSCNDEGYPTIGGENLLNAEDHNIIPKHLPPEVKANVWVCPGCGKPISKLPSFNP